MIGIGYLIGDNSVIPFLLSVAQELSPGLKASALRALIQFKTPQAADIFLLSYQNQNTEIRKYGNTEIGN